MFSLLRKKLKNWPKKVGERCTPYRYRSFASLAESSNSISHPSKDVLEYYTSVLLLKLSSDQGKYIFISLIKPSEHYLHAILFHFAIRIRWANFEREDYKSIKEDNKSIKELYAWSTKGREVIGNCIHNFSLALYT